jgi:hypothetical protein
MGSMYYVVDEQGRNVFELGKTGRVWGVLWPMTADDFEQVEYADPYWREDAEALGPSVARSIRPCTRYRPWWLTAGPSGRRTTRRGRIARYGGAGRR